MKDFNFFAPTEIVFGKESEEKIAELVSRSSQGRNDYQVEEILSGK